MKAIIALVLVCIFEAVVGNIVIREGYYTRNPVEEYYVKPQVQVGPKYFYSGEPKYQDSGKSVNENYYDNDSLKKTVDNTQESALEKLHGVEGDHRVNYHTQGRHDFEHGGTARTSETEATALAGKRKFYGKSSGSGYGGRGSSGFRKGHKNTGFHKTYHNEESGKDSHYVDEEHKIGGEGYDKSYEGRFGEAAGESSVGVDRGAGYGYRSSGRGREGSALESSGVRDSRFAHRDHIGSFEDKESAVRDELAGSYQRDLHTGSHNFGRYEPAY